MKPIVLIEDNPDDEQLTIRALRRGKIANDIVVARNGEQALQTLFSMEVLPSIVILDLKLPKISGLDVLRQIRANTKTQFLPVVVLTSSGEDRDIIESYSLGANSYVQKPVDFNEFNEAVHRLGLYWVLVNQSSL